MYLLSEKLNYYTNTGDLTGSILTDVIDTQRFGKRLPALIDFNCEFDFFGLAGTIVRGRVLTHFNSTWTDDANNNNILPCWHGSGDTVVFAIAPTILGAVVQGSRIIHAANFASHTSVPAIGEALPRYIRLKLSVTGTYDNTPGDSKFGTKIHYRLYSNVGSDHVL